MNDTFIDEGKKLKDRKVVLTDGGSKKLSQLSGKSGLIVYLYPKDNTPGCTKEACSFRDEYSVLKKMGYEVVGVSKDSVDSHKRFTEKHSLPFPLISDTEGELIQELGAWQEKKNYGKTYMGIVRSTFILDPKLKVRKVYPRVKTNTHASDIIADLGDEK